MLGKAGAGGVHWGQGQGSWTEISSWPDVERALQLAPYGGRNGDPPLVPWLCSPCPPASGLGFRQRRQSEG